MNNEKIYVLFEEISELKDALNSAIESANNISDLKTYSASAEKIIMQFRLIVLLTEKKLVI